MSVNKLLQRVVAPELTFKRRSLQMDGNSLKKQIASDLHNYTYGITSDPLTQFAVVFAALIHDCDHWGESLVEGSARRYSDNARVPELTCALSLHSQVSPMPNL